MWMTHLAKKSDGSESYKRVAMIAAILQDFDVCKSKLIERGQKFASSSLKSRQKIAELSHNFVRDGMTVLTHGYSRVVVTLLLRASKNRHFSVLVSESRPDHAG